MNFDHRIIAACLAGLVFSSSAVLADDAKPAAPAPVAQSAAPAAGAPTAAPPPPEALKAWGKFCDPAADGHKICIVRKLVFQGNTIMASVSLRVDTAKGVPTLAVAAVPVGVVLTPGLLWQIDKQKPVALPYWRCTPQTCESEQLVKPDFIDKLRKGTTLTLTAKDVQGKNVVMAVPLSGFAAAYDQQNAPTFAEYNKTLAEAEKQAH